MLTDIFDCFNVCFFFSFQIVNALDLAYGRYLTASMQIGLSPFR